jgi:hypothetical protein
LAVRHFFVEAAEPVHLGTISPSPRP